MQADQLITPTDMRPVDVLSAVATDVKDVIDGYATMVDRAEDDLKPFVQRLRALHESHLRELFAELQHLGGHPKDTGSYMATVHTAVATLRDWTGTLDASALPQIIDGEDTIIASYDSALNDLQKHPAQRSLIEKHRAALATHVDALRD
ncbi:hypothetical protein A8B78_08880 [Jannaschia sp. EhC01]|nr:hypothetical protein A8B78_08880 [Jannaschia sp. EhC01]